MTLVVAISAEEAPVVAATLYNECVEVRRQIGYVLSEDELADGPVIDFKINLKTQNLDEASVRVEDAKGSAIILEVAGGHTITTATSIIMEYPKANKLYETLIQKLKEKRRLESRVGEAEGCKKALTTMRTNVVHERAGPLSSLPSVEPSATNSLVKNLLNLSAMITQEIATIDEDTMDTQTELRKLRDECIEIKEQIREICGVDFNVTCDAEEALRNAAECLTGCRTRMTKHVIVKCDVKVAGPIEFDLVYTQSGAYWSPAYDLKATTTNLNSAHLTYFGVVKQSTKEDWKDISLNLSTGSPSLAGHPKSLPALKVGYPAPHPPRAPRSCGLYGAGNVMLARSARATDGVEEPVTFQSGMMMERVMMEVKDEGGSQDTFGLAGKYCVPSDGEAHKLAITEADLEAKTYYYAFPEADQCVFRAAMLRNASDFFLLPSQEVSVFCNNSFIAKTNMPAVPPETDFQTFLGREVQIQLEIQPLRKYRKTAGSMFTGGTTDKEVFEHAGWVQNNRKEAIVLMAVFRLPRSCDETIKVQLDPSLGKAVTVQCKNDLEVFAHSSVPQPDARSPSLTIVNEPTDHCIILRYLEPGQKSKISCSYSIERPINKAIEIA